MERIDGIQESQVIDVTLADATLAGGEITLSGCRAIKSDVDGKVKIRVKPDNAPAYDTVEPLSGGVWHQQRNVIAVYQFTSGGNAATTQVYTSADVLVNGLKLGR